MKYFQQILLAMAIVTSFGVIAPSVVSAEATPAPAPTPAVNPQDEIKKAVVSGGGTTGDDGIKNGIKIIVDTLLFVIGAIAVIVIIVGGIRYTVSGGDANQMASAKNTIMYAAIGLIVAILAYAIVNWIIVTFTK